jgi:hypothetical protein
MLSLLFPRSPLDSWEKAWTETRMCWLADNLGIDRMLQAQVVLPTEEFFPEAYAGTRDDVRRLLDQLCGYMRLDSKRIDLEITPETDMPGAAGTYQLAVRPTIRISTSQLGDPMSLISTLAHELAHEVLLGGRLLMTDVWDHEWVTDLLPNFLGLGIFGANAVLKEESRRVAGTGRWSLWRHGYLPARIHGYALALFAFMRGERSPRWARHLRADAAVAMTAGLRYLRRTGDSVFHPDTIRSRSKQPTDSELLDLMRSGVASSQMAALFELNEMSSPSPEIVAAVTALLKSQDARLPGQAAETLSQFGKAAQGAIPDLFKCLESSSDESRAKAAKALGTVAPTGQPVAEHLIAILGDVSPEVVAESAWALHRYAHLVSPWAEEVLTALRRALVRNNEKTTESLISLLCKATSDPRDRICEYFGDHDCELREVALEVLEFVQKTDAVGKQGADARASAHFG